MSVNFKPLADDGMGQIPVIATINGTQHQARAAYGAIAALERPARVVHLAGRGEAARRADRAARDAKLARLHNRLMLIAAAIAAPALIAYATGWL